MADPASLNEAIYDVLHGDDTLLNTVSDVYNGIAPDDATYPFTAWDMTTAPDTYTIGKRVMTSYNVQVQTIDEGYSRVNCNTAQKRVDVLLTDQTGDITVSGYTTWKARRVGQREYSESVGSGNVYQHVIGEWEIILSPEA